MPIKKSYLTISIVLVLLLCVTQIIGNTLLIVPCLAAFLVFVGWCCSNNYTLPILLFFLPWSPILRTSPDSYSFFTFGLVLVCAISVIKKRFHFKKYPLAIGIVLLFLTLVAKVANGHGLSFDYAAFMMLIVVFPVVKEEWREGKYEFYQVVVFFALGVVIAALCALNFAVFPNITRFIRVDSYLTVTRRSGFYGDANFYTAQITAALGGCLTLLLTQKKRGHTVLLGIMTFVLLYCGFLSASKSFVIVAAMVVALWIIAFLRMRGRTGFKVIMLIAIILAAVVIATSALFGELIEVLATRFSFSNDLDSFTTGRTALWISYVKEILNNVKLFFLGEGFTSVRVNDRASHNSLLQTFYQFGFLGAPFLAVWVGTFYRDASTRGYKRRRTTLEQVIIATGVFMPWLAIDILFFDDFFLLQWYMFSAVQMLRREQAVDSVPLEDHYG